MSYTKSLVLGSLLSIIGGIIIAVLIQGRVGIAYGILLAVTLSVIWGGIIYILSNKKDKANKKFKNYVKAMICVLISMYTFTIALPNCIFGHTLPARIGIPICVISLLGLIGVGYFAYKSANEVKKNDDIDES